MKAIKPIWIVVILSLFTSTFFNQLNLKKLPNEGLRENETVRTNDDLSYLRPAIHFYQTGIWKDEIKGDLSYFLRPPGYGAIYYIALVINPNRPLLVLKIIQVLLFSISVYCLFFIAFSFLQFKKLALIVSIIYGLTPLASNFLFYTLTEGVTPALFIFYLFFLLKAKNQSQPKNRFLYLALSASIFASLFIIRPVLGIFIGLIPLTVFLSYDVIKHKIFYSIIFTALGYSFMGFWQYRNYKLTNQYIGLHPIYYADNNSIYRPTLQEFWNFTLGWAEDGSTVHTYMLPFWENTIKGDTSKVYINNIVEHFPIYVQKYFGKERLTDVLTNYQKSILYQKQFYDRDETMPLTKIDIETTTVIQLKQLVAEFKKEFWFTYYISSPIKVYIKMGFHSNLSLYIFQKTYRGNFFMESLRWFSFLIHAASFISIFFVLFWNKKINLLNYFIYFFSFIYLFYLCFFQRGIEERYTLPILSILLIAFFNISLLMQRFLLQKMNKYKKH